MASQFWFERRANPPASLIKTKNPRHLKKKKKNCQGLKFGTGAGQGLE